MLHFFQMIGLDASLGAEIAYTYDATLLFFSYLTAALAAYVASAVVERMQATGSRSAYALWLGAGALIAGLGTWSMHFTGMLALQLPFVVTYSLKLTVLSVVPAILGSAVAVHYLARPDKTLRTLLTSAACFAIGICLMHYTGMEAMRMEAVMRYETLVFSLSILVALLLATASLMVQSIPHPESAWGAGAARIVGAAMMGLTISAMHYTSMAAVTYYVTPATDLVLDPGSITSFWLAALIVVVFLVIGALTVIGALIDRHLEKIYRKLDDSRARNAAILNQMQDGLLSFPSSGLLERINPKAVDLFELPDDASGVGMPVTTLLPDAVKMLENGQIEPRLGTFETLARRTSGVRFRAELSVIAISVKNESLYTVFVRDQTARLQMETQLRQAQKLESIGQMAAGIAHEINTPVQYISDNTIFLQRAFGGLVDALEAARRLLDAIEQRSEQREPVETLRQRFRKARIDYLQEQVPRAISQSLEGLDRVSRIVLAMKDFSHPSQGEKVPVDLSHTIEVTVTVARNEWKYVADVETEFSADVPPVPCLRDEFNQVILNMIVNAAHAIEAKLQDKENDRGTITIRTARVNDWAVIEISDTGSGIPDSIRNQIFDPFFTTKEVGKGTGQGLAIARNVIVDKHGGSIDVVSREGEGTKFTLRLPLVDNRAEAVGEEAA